LFVVVLLLPCLTGLRTSALSATTARSCARMPPSARSCRRRRMRRRLPRLASSRRLVRLLSFRSPSPLSSRLRTSR
jgi:hypothetical protein